MGIANFNESLKKGKVVEAFAEEYFLKNNMNYVDVRDNPEYQKIDVDYIIDDKTYEVKQNYHNAMYGKEGWYFWVELKVGYRLGWWYFTKADYFIFLNIYGSGIIIENNHILKNYVNNAIENGDHSKYGNNRVDIIEDQRYNRAIEVINLRVYLDDLNNTNVNMQKLVKRKK